MSHQTIATKGGIYWESFQIGSDTYLAVFGISSPSISLNCRKLIESVGFEGSCIRIFTVLNKYSFGSSPKNVCDAADVLDLETPRGTVEKSNVAGIKSTSINCAQVLTSLPTS